MKNICGALLGAFLLAACTGAQRAILDHGVTRIQDANDAEAELLKATTCGVRLGAYFRVYSEAEQGAFDVLCGGAWARPVTLDDLRGLLRELMELVAPRPGASE